MAIKDLQARQGNADVTGEIKEIGDIREFEKFGKKGRVANAILKDHTGEIKLSLWNEQIDNLKVGDKIKITNGYVNEWQGEKQLTTGKFGKLEVIGSKEKDVEKEIEKDLKKSEKEAGKEDLEEEVEEEFKSDEEDLEKEVEEEEIKVDEELVD